MDICLTGIFNAKYILLLKPSSIRSYDLELDEAQSEVLGPGEHLRVQLLPRDNRDDHDSAAADTSPGTTDRTG